MISLIASAAVLLRASVDFIGLIGTGFPIFLLVLFVVFGILFLLFNAGAPSIVQHLKDIAQEKVAKGEFLFVRGAISDAKSGAEATTRVYNRSILKGPNVLITGIGGIPDHFARWERELAQLGHAVIHDKVVVIDPFSDDCVVVTGSHNLGFKASYSNDENMCIVRGNRKLAEAYATHVLDVVSHFNFRNKLAEQFKKTKRLDKAFQHLDKSDTWQDKYFKKNFLASRDEFFFNPK